MNAGLGRVREAGGNRRPLARSHPTENAWWPIMSCAAIHRSCQVGGVTYESPVSGSSNDQSNNKNAARRRTAVGTAVGL